MEICIVNMVLFIPNGGSLSVCPLTHLTSSGEQPLNRNSTHTDQYQVRGGSRGSSVNRLLAQHESGAWVTSSLERHHINQMIAPV